MARVLNTNYHFFHLLLMLLWWNLHLLNLGFCINKGRNALFCFPPRDMQVGNIQNQRFVDAPHSTKFSMKMKASSGLILINFVPLLKHDSFTISRYLLMIPPLHHLKSVWWCLVGFLPKFNVLNDLKSAKKLNHARENLKECCAGRTTACFISECTGGWKFYQSNATSFECR